jgi:hypothetical protein
MGLDVTAMLVAGVIVKESKIIQEVQKFDENTGLPCLKKIHRFRYEFGGETVEYDDVITFFSSIHEKAFSVKDKGSGEYLVYMVIDETESHRFGEPYKEVNPEFLLFRLEQIKNMFSCFDIKRVFVRLYLLNDVC